jgi:ribosome maturation factor RimP
MGARAPICFEEGDLATPRELEKQLEREVTRQVEAAMPGVEVLALELVSPQRFCVYIDHAQGVDHTLCERVTNVLRGYLDRYSVDVSSPGLERPLRKPAHFARVVGHRVQLRTASEIGGRRRFRGEVRSAGERGVTVGVDGTEVDIPYEAIVRGNLIDEG